MSEKITDCCSDLKEGLGIASLVLGIAGIIFFWIPIFGLACGVVGIVFAAKQRQKTFSGITTAGFVLSIIGTVFSAMFNLLWLVGVIMLATI